MNQFELNFEESPGERLQRLKEEYREKVGVAPDTDDPNAIEEYLKDPSAERARRVLKEQDEDRGLPWQIR